MPIIGDQTIYTTSYSGVNIITGGTFTCPIGGPFQVTKLTAYLTVLGGTNRLCKAAIYTAAGNLVANSTTQEITIINNNLTWYDFPYSGNYPVLTGGDVYTLVIWYSINVYIYRNNTNLGTTDQFKARSVGSYGGNFPASITSWPATSNNSTSIYATLLGPDPQVADDANNLADSIEVRKNGLLEIADSLELSDEIAIRLIAGDPLYAADSLSNWADSVQRNYAIWQVIQPVTIGDSFIVTAGKPPRNDWKDSIELNLTPFGDLDIYVDDLRIMSADETTIGLGLLIGDSLDNWLDAVINKHGSEALAYDTLFYNLFDSVIINLHIPQTASATDSLNNWLDSIFTSIVRGYGVSDSMNQYDEITLFVAWRLLVADQLSLSDAIALFDSRMPIAADELLFIDSVELQLSAALTTSVADSFSMSDAVGTPLLNTSFTSYLRRYLNDVID